jgi:hypothetical protein
MTERGPIECTWDGEAFKPVSPYWTRRAGREYVLGEVYRMADVPERSAGAHNSFFAEVERAWESLPPLMAERFPSPKHLRSYALIKSGHCYSDSIACPNHAYAMRIAAFVRSSDEFALVTVEKAMVTRFTPKSQSYHSMGKSEFNKSAEDCRRVLAEMLNVSQQELADAGAAHV